MYLLVYLSQAVTCLSNAQDNKLCIKQRATKFNALCLPCSRPFAVVPGTTA